MELTAELTAELAGVVKEGDVSRVVSILRSGRCHINAIDEVCLNISNMVIVCIQMYYLRIYL